MNKILHIAPDEKFIDFVIDVFDSLEGVDNHFMVLKKGRKESKFIKNTARITILNPGQILTQEFLAQLKNYQAVLLHEFYGAKIAMVNACPDDVNFVWLSWGADMYSQHPNLRRQLYLKKTNLISWKTDTWYRFKTILKPLLDVLGIRREVYKKQEKALSKIDYIAPVIYEDFQLIKKHYRNSKHCKFLPFAYGDINSFAKGSSQITGHDILLGNSASATNNHVEVIDILSNININDKKVYVPLSYGNAKYAEKITNYGKSKIGINFEQLIDFLPVDQYLKIISSCKFVIMNHRRQQGMGNIYAMLFLGAKLFLRTDNPAFDYLIRQNLTVFKIADLQKKDTFIGLTDLQKIENKRIIHSLFSPEVVQEHARKMIKEVCVR